jgi:hypothetical protein
MEDANTTNHATPEGVVTETCPHCGQDYKVPTECAGKLPYCPPCILTIFPLGDEEVLRIPNEENPNG